jgi:branched-chain amino acid transport system ATP-binding protein
LAVCLSTKKVSKSFGSLAAVVDVSFEVEQGEIFGIAGPNGAGKTTLFNMITGLPFKPDGGEVWFDGKRIDLLSAHKIYQAGLSRTFQQEIAFDGLSVEDNIRVACHYSGNRMTRQEQRERIDMALDLTSLGAYRSKEARDLPFFEKKKLMFSTAIAANPKLLMLDEPAAGLSQAEGKELISVVKRLKETGITVVIIEHVLPILFGVSDRLMILDAGQVLTIDRPDVVAKDARVITAYLGERHHGKKGK